MPKSPEVVGAVAQQEEASWGLGDGAVGRSGREWQQTGQEVTKILWCLLVSLCKYMRFFQRKDGLFFFQM